MSQIAQPLPADKPVASIRDVTHRYGNAVALDHLSLEIPSGIMVGIVGPDGVGKSTLMALIAGSKKLQQGSLTVLDGDIADKRHRRSVRALRTCLRGWARTSTWSSASTTTSTSWRGCSGFRPPSAGCGSRTCS